MTNESSRTVDVVLVGAGPIGLELALALKDAGANYVHLEAEQIGHTISWFPRQARFFSSPDRISICGVPLVTVDQSKASREDYLAYLWGVVQQFHLEVQTYERVTAVLPNEDNSASRYRVLTHSSRGDQVYQTQHVIFAIGDMHGPRPLVHPGMGHVEGADLPHVSHYFDEPHPYAGRRLLIVGGKNSAIEAAIRCHRAGAKVTLCQRQPELSSSIKYWLKPEMDWYIESGEIEFYPQRVPVRITPTQVELAPIDHDLQPIADPASHVTCPADFVLLLIGYVMDPTLLQEVGVELYGPGMTPRVNPETMQTNVPGIYVAGTAAAGTQLSYKLFIENCHAHVVRITRHLLQQDPKHINPLAYARLNEHPIPAES